MTTRDYGIDDNALDRIDAEWKAYFLGLFAADGTVKSNGVRIKLPQADAAVLEQLRTHFQLTHRLTSDGNNRCLYFSSQSICEQLQVLGLRAKKAERLRELPRIPDELLRHFVRGFFDGDGSVSNRAARPGQRTVSIGISHKPFLAALQKWFAANGVLAGIYCEKRKGKRLRSPQGGYRTTYRDMYRLVFTTHDARLALIALCWKDATIFLERKYALLAAYQKTQNTAVQNGSRVFAWPDIYREYLAGKTPHELGKKYGFYWRSLYHWMSRTGSPSKTSVIGPSLSDQGEQSPPLAGNP